jgi:hypothetical protein
MGSRLGEILVEQRLISEDEVQRLLVLQAAIGEPGQAPRLGEIIVQQGLLPSEAISEALRLQHARRRFEG